MLLLGPEEEHPDGHGIGGQPHNKHNDVDDREEDCCKTAAQDFAGLGVERHPLTGLRASEAFSL